MRIGITTFDGGANYGSMLQAWASWHFLAAQGHEVQFINGGNSCLQVVHYPLLLCLISRNIKVYFHPAAYLANVKRRLFSRIIYSHMTPFAENYPRARRYNNLKELKNYTEQLDAVVVGSDTVWRPFAWDILYNYGTFLNWVKPGVKRLSYAASFASPVWGKEHATEMASFLKDFDAISVREQSGVEIARKLSGRSDVKQVIDPTFLLSAEDYEGVIKAPKFKGKYVLSYLLHLTDGKIKESVDNICRSEFNGAEVLDDRMDPTSFIERIIAKHILKTKAKISVPEWLGRIKNAEFLLTNSFHGTAFAIQFHTPFAVVQFDKDHAYRDEGGCPLPSGINERFVSLLTSLGLSDRIVSLNEPEKIRSVLHSKIDWQSVDEKLKAIKDDSRSWLLSQLTKQ